MTALEYRILDYVGRRNPTDPVVHRIMNDKERSVFAALREDGLIERMQEEDRYQLSAKGKTKMLRETMR